MTDLSEKLREAFKRKRYVAGDDYDPDFDLFDAAADEIERLTRYNKFWKSMAKLAKIDAYRKTL